MEKKNHTQGRVVKDPKIDARAALITSTFGQVGDATERIGSKALIRVPVEKIKIHPDQPRVTYDQAELEKLAESIRRHGNEPIEPIVTTEREGDTYWLIAGTRRYKACVDILHLTHMRIHTTSQSPAIVGLIENIQRKNLHPLEVAEGINRLIEVHGMEQAGAGEELGMQETRISEYLKLRDLPDEIKKEWLANKDHARNLMQMVNLARYTDPVEQLKRWERLKQAAKQGVGVHDRPSRAKKQTSIGYRSLRSRLRFFSAANLVNRIPARNWKPAMRRDALKDIRVLKHQIEQIEKHIETSGPLKDPKPKEVTQ